MSVKVSLFTPAFWRGARRGFIRANLIGLPLCVVALLGRAWGWW